MTARIAATNAPDTYFELVKEFPLVHIRDAAHLDEALAMVDRLLSKVMDDGTESYLDVLTDLVESYEREHFEVPDVKDVDVLRELMRSNGLSQSALSRAVGISQSTISAVLNGRRPLTRDHIAKLARHFNVRQAAFLPV